MKNKTRKIKNNKINAICVIHENSNGISGHIKFSQRKNSKRVKIEYEIKGLKNGNHGFHVHEWRFNRWMPQ